MTWFKSLIMRQSSPLLRIDPCDKQRGGRSSSARDLQSCTGTKRNNTYNSSRRQARQIVRSSGRVSKISSALVEVTEAGILPTIQEWNSKETSNNIQVSQSKSCTTKLLHLGDNHLRCHQAAVNHISRWHEDITSHNTQDSSQKKRKMSSAKRMWHPMLALLIVVVGILMPCCCLCSLITAPVDPAPAPTAAALLAGQQQYFEVQPEAQYLVQNGQDQRLRCIVRNRQGECLWLRNGKAIGSIAKKYQFVRQPEDGDCSLMIRNVSVQQDNGVWQCQVTAADADQETLPSREVNLVVLVAPERPQIKNVTLHNTQRLVMEENKTKFVVCEMRGGNPAPQIEWLLDNKNITKEAQSSTTLEKAGQPAAAAAQTGGLRITQSRLKMSDIKRNMNGKNLTCVGVHQTLNQSVSVELDVQYVPTVSVVQREYSIVEGSPLSISCQVDANPPPNIINWRLVSDGPSSPRSGHSQQQAAAAPGGAITLPTRPGPVLEFERISRDLNQNIFECLAQNSYGISLPADVKLNVLYAPFLLNTSHSESVAVGSEAQLACIFDGNPEPEVKWHYTDPLSRSAQAQQLDNQKQQYLAIKNVTYRNEGDYHCEARNQINGVFYGVRSSNILLDVFGEPQFLVKSPTHAKAIQGSKSELALSFCADPPPNKVYWQFGSLRLDVRLTNTNGQQPAGGPMTPASGMSAKQSFMSQRFQVNPLQPLQKRDSSFSKTPTCFEASLTIVDPELTDQRDYTLVVQNERGHQSAVVRLRVASPLSPVLMISSAFVTICGLFLCSLIVMFLIKKRRQLVNSNSAAMNGHSQNGAGAKNGVEHLVNGSGPNAATATALATAAAANAQLMQQQTRGVVNGLGNGVANGAGNPHQQNSNKELTLVPSSNKSGPLASMASSDGSGDQRQLLASAGSSADSHHLLNQHHRQHHHHQRQSSDYTTPSSLSSGATCRSTTTTTSTPSPMNHVSVDDESTYQAAESVTSHHQLDAASGTGSALIYANLDYTENLPHPGYATSLVSPGSQMSQQRMSATTEQQHQQMHSPANSSLTDSIPSILAAHNGSSNANTGERQLPPARRSSSPIRSSVGATIAMMNSLAAAAANQQGISSPAGVGALNGAINQQLANSRQIRKAGPPKPPKPSIQQRNRFFQQQQQQQNGNNGLVMIGQAGLEGYTNPMDTMEQSANELAVEYSRIAFPARAEL